MAANGLPGANSMGATNFGYPLPQQQNRFLQSMLPNPDCVYDYILYCQAVPALHHEPQKFKLGRLNEAEFDMLCQMLSGGFG